MDYSSYHGKIAEVVTALTEMEGLCDRLKLEEAKKTLTASRKKLTSHKFSVGIMGEFKRGKSTVINSLLGQEIMPADILPATATMNRVTYDLKPHAEVIKNDGTKIDIPVEEIVNYVTKINTENARRAEMVDEAIVYYPCQFCQNGVDIVDTPGLNDDERMDKISEEVIPKLDAVIMVIVPGAPFSMSENNFVRNKLLGSDLGRLIFVMNKMDTVRPKDRERVVKDVIGRIHTSVLEKTAEVYGRDSREYADAVNKIGQIRVFPISAADALDARTGGDSELLKESGILEFEAALTHLLTVERGMLELSAPISVMSRTADDLVKAAEMRKKSQQLTAQEFEKRQKEALGKIEEMRLQKRQEAKRINSASSQTKAELLPQVASFYDTLESDLIQIVDNLPINRASLVKEAGMNAAAVKVQEAVDEEIRSKMANMAERMQKQIMDAAGEEAARCAAHTTKIIDDLNDNISLTFDVPAGKDDKGLLSKSNATSLAGFAFDVLTDIVGGPWGLTGLVEGYKSSGIKGAAVGLGAGIVTTFATAAILGPVGVVGLPLAVIASVASGATGKLAAQKLFPPNGNKEYQAFIENAHKQIHESAASMRTSRALESAVETRVDAVFSTLSALMSEELEKAVQDMENTIELIKKDLTKSELQRGQAIRECDEIIESVGKITSRMVPLAESLRKGTIVG